MSAGATGPARRGASDPHGVLDVSTFLGSYPFRHIPHPDPDVLVRVLEREGITRAWVGHLPSAFHRDPTAGNAELFASIEPFGDTLRATPAIRPDWPEWERALRDVVDQGAAAVRAYPPQWGLGAGSGAMATLAAACGEAGVPLLLTTRFEDSRQRHWMDAAGDLSGAAIRALARVPRARLVVTAASREVVEEVHWGLTAEERERVWWDISWIWGPPEDHLAKLFRSVGSARFVYGSMWPLRLTQTPSANLALLPDDVRDAPLGVPPAAGA